MQVAVLPERVAAIAAVCWTLVKRLSPLTRILALHTILVLVLMVEAKLMVKLNTYVPVVGVTVAGLTVTASSELDVEVLSKALLRASAMSRLQDDCLVCDS
ncbi:MAG TPA: hypothetical protein VLW84_02460 [Terriglobales bacterium]|nr:hypothetical protein [Terriglobales bacterium]